MSLMFMKNSSVTLDLDADPSIPAGYELVEHQRQGQILVSGNSIAGASFIRNDTLTQTTHKQLATQLPGRPANANFVDCFLESPHEVPREMQPINYHYFFFLGSTYKKVGDTSGDLYAQYLFSEGGKWKGGIGPICEEMLDYDYLVMI